MHFAQYSPGITKVDFFVCMKDNGVSVPVGSFTKSGQVATSYLALIFNTGDRHVHLYLKYNNMRWSGVMYNVVH